MAEPVRVDVHMHLYESRAVGDWWKAGYEIWEYGPKDDVRFSASSGTVEEAVIALERAGFSHGIAVNLFSMELAAAEAELKLPPDFIGEQRERYVADMRANTPELLRESNRWLCEALAEVPQITPFIAVDPWALSPEENSEHLRKMAGRGARGIKVHPAIQRFSPADPRMHPVYQACRELGLAVLSHSGSSKGVEQYAEPNAFVDMLRDFPELTVVLAHLGGGSWRQTVELAKAFPQASFDLCEIIAWTGAPNAPTEEELAVMIGAIGPDRVMLGTDFPWYDLDVTVERVMDLPILSQEVKEGILGSNAVRILGLDL
jgi:uncharacterized protein